MAKIDIDYSTLNDKEKLYCEAVERYYSDDVDYQDPLMSDAEFDILEIYVKKTNPDLVARVGSTKRGDVPHKSLMLSLAKTKVWDDDDLSEAMTELEKKFFSKCRANGAKEYEAGPKLDGNANNLIYADGVLIHAITRSDGDMGFEKKAKLMHIVPRTIPMKGIVEIRGEIVIPTSIFEEKYIKCEERPDGKENERNYVAGVLARNEVDIPAVKELIFAAIELRVYDQPNPKVFSYMKDSMGVLKSWGFNQQYEPLFVNFKDINDFPMIYKKYSDYRDNVDIRLDGIVIKADEAVRVKMGFNSHDPNWARAIKFPPKDAITTITDHLFTTGTTGVVNTVADLDPIYIDGSTVTKANLASWSNVVDYKLSGKAAGIGAEVVIAKSGDIIPHIFRITKEGTPPVMPTECPTCKSKLEFDGTQLWCRNDFCEAQTMTKLEKGLKVLKVKGIADATVEKLHNAGIKTILDVFNPAKFNETYLINNSGGDFVKGRALEKILEAVRKVRKVPYEKVMESLKIKDVGKSVSKQVTLCIHDLEYSFESLNQSAVAKMLDGKTKEYKLFSDFLEVLNDAGVQVVSPEPEEETDGNEIRYVMTGKPENSCSIKSKGEFGKILAVEGYLHVGKFSATKIKGGEPVDYLITDDYNSTTTKMKDAVKYGAEIITYADMLKKLGIADSGPLPKGGKKQVDTPNKPSTGSLF